MTDAAAAGRTLAAIRDARPLVHNITNRVVMNNTANALLAIGASPAMVEATDEVEEFVRISRAVVINIGTLSPQQAAGMRLATLTATACGTPWILDPVAAGVLRYRTGLALDLLANQPAAIRGNASEILSLAGGEGAGKGVDTTAAAAAAVEHAKRLAKRSGAVVAVTGAVDYVTDGERVAEVHNGHAMMARVTGMGCTATAVIAAALAVESDRFAAVVHGLGFMGVAGEMAAERARGPGSLQLEFLDALFLLDAATLAARLHLKG